MAEQAQTGCGGFIVFIMAIVNVAIGASVSSNIIIYAKLFSSITATINELINCVRFSIKRIVILLYQHTLWLLVE